MRRLRLSFQRVVLATALVGAGVVLASALAGGAVAAGSASYGDPTGDAANGAADISNIAISNDDSGNITFRVDFANRTSLGADEAVYIYIDADQNPSTGCNGSDYRIQGLGGDNAVKLVPCSGGTFTDGPVVGTYGAPMTATVNRSSLGNTSAFSFFAATLKNGASGDYVPDSATSGSRLAYALVFAPTTTPPTTPPPPPGGGGGTTGGGSTTQHPVDTTDTDHDGIVDSADGCPTVPAGPYDFNRNGCPGPFPEIIPQIPTAAATGGGRTWWTSGRIGNVPEGATVTVQYKRAREVRHVGPSGHVTSKLFTSRHFLRGSVLTLRVVKPGYVGFYARLIVVTKAPGWKGVKRLCVDPTAGGRPVGCTSIDHGR